MIKVFQVFLLNKETMIIMNAQDDAEKYFKLDEFECIGIVIQFLDKKILIIVLHIKHCTFKIKNPNL